ncbi:MAG TPA: FTR1 family protein [Gemmatimonadales bacterium]|nr:FTR1 family protein [Gemmatimonadales bacterium]
MAFVLSRARVRTAFTFVACSFLATVPLPAQSDQDAARRIADIAAVAMDEYALGVADGQIVNRPEYEEARLFLTEARRAAGALSPDVAAATTTALDAIIAGVEARRDPSALRALVDSMRVSLSAAVGIALDPAPREVPSLEAGEKIYREQCAACHGATGRGDGPRAVGLEPPPADFTVPALRASSPLDFFRKINVGVAGTAMPGFQGILDENARWAVALYASSLRAGERERATGEAALRRACPECLPFVSSFIRTSGLTDDSLASLLAGRVGAGPDDPVTRAAVAFSRIAGAAEELGRDRRLEVVRVVSEAREGLAAARAIAAAGDRETAGRRALDAYLVFERIEASVRARDPDAAGEVEASFAAVRATIASGSPSAVDSSVQRAERALDRAAQAMAAETAPGLLFAQSLVIILREGFEAILVVGALMAFLSRAGAPERRRDIGLGVLWAVLASLLTAAAFATLFRSAAGSQEALEGATMLVAALVLFWVSYWLVSKVEVKKWQAFVATRMDKALTSGRALALAAVAFLAVYREGFETVLFYAALFATADGTARAAASIGAGLVVGSLLLGIVYYLMQRYGGRLPLKPFFAVTSALLYLMAFTFAGQGVAELQEAGYLPMTPLEWLPRVPALGIFPTIQTFLAQSLLAAALALALVWVFWLEPRQSRGVTA